jgi:hypothetical protein
MSTSDRLDTLREDFWEHRGGKKEIKNLSVSISHENTKKYP